MLPFDLLFPDVARKESRGATLIAPGGQHLGQFLFRELYCADQNCDCRILLVQAFSAARARVVAAFSYCFEPLEGEPQFEIDPLQPQSELSEPLFEMFQHALVEDPAYRPALLRHYAMWKAIVDDPAHPDHGKLRGSAKAGSARATSRPQPKKRKPSRAKTEKAKPAGPAPAASSGTNLELLDRAPRAQSKSQKKFRTLLEKVDKLKQQVAAWRERRADIDSGHDAYQAAARVRTELLRKMVLLLDGAHDKLAKKDRKAARELIVDLGRGLTRMGATDDAELKRVLERHAGPADAKAEAQELDMVKGLLDLMGLDVEDMPGAQTADELLANAQKQILRSLEEDERARDERRKKRKPTAKQVAAEQLRAAEAADAHKAVAEIYRQLARSMHPDREPDPLERERKTSLMREINAAYEARDLLALLELQLRVEGVNLGDNLEALAEERLVRYIRVLDEQAKQLSIEIDTTELPFRIALARGPGVPITPAMVLENLRADLRIAESHSAELTRDLVAFEDLGYLTRWLRTQGALTPP
jgi:hypothetical protein